VLAAVRQLLERLDQHSIPGGRRDLTQSLATAGLVEALYSPPSFWPQLVQGLQLAAFADDGTMLLKWADAYYQRDSAGHFSQFNSSFPAIRCLDSTDHGLAGALRDWHRTEQKAPTIAPFMGPDVGCPTWPVKSTGDTERKIDYAGEVPVVIVGTTGDPATPYAYARHMHAALTSSRLITLHSSGHLGYDQSPCVQQKVLRYLVQDQVPAHDSTCTDG
jgi:pimeloyl-ACP methyl ester carboxylesterase